MRILSAMRTSARSPVLQVVKSAVAIALAWLIASVVLSVPMPIFAAIAALLVVAPSVNQSLSKGIERSAGVVIGVLIASALGIVLGDASWVALVAIAVALGLGWAFKATPGMSNQMAISGMLVLALGSSTPMYALDRILETVIGAVIGIAINALIVPPVLVEPARTAVALLGDEISASLARLADALTAQQQPDQLQQLMIEARLLRPMREAAEAAIAAGHESLTLNPRRSRHRDELAQMNELVQRRLSPISTQVIGMTRAFFDQYDDTVAHEDIARAISEQLRRAAHDVRLAVHEAEVEPDPPTSAIPALTAPLTIRAPRSDHWVLFGALMEDLRRIHVELTEPEPN